MTRHERVTASWLQARSWQQQFDGRWRHPTLTPKGPLPADQAVLAQTRHERGQAEAARARDIQRADRGMDDDWREAALAAIRATAERVAELTTDHVMDGHPDLPEPHEPRAWEVVMLAAAAEGWIVATDRMGKSCRRSSHARMKRTWSSLLVGGHTRETIPTMELSEVVR
jgi:hypothetical protein